MPGARITSDTQRQYFSGDHEMITRISIATAGLFVATLLTITAFIERQSFSLSDLYINLATEIPEIVITILSIDWLLDRKKYFDEAARIAQTALNSIDSAIWIYQGGTRKFDLAELSFLLGKVKDDDPLPNFTENIFLALGSKAENTFRVSTESIRINPVSKQGLQKLSNLNTMRDSNRSVRNRKIAEHILQAVYNLTDVVGYDSTKPMSDTPLKYRNSSIERQEWLRFGGNMHNLSYE
jgi:hypothetical protein